MDLALKERLDKEINFRNSYDELSEEKPDPLMVARKYNDEYIGLICALFAYGKASLIVKFLRSLNFDLLNEKDETIYKELKNHYYRFQTSVDVAEFFITIKRLKDIDSLENIFYSGYKEQNLVLKGLERLISKIYEINRYTSQGYNFLVGSLDKTSPYKRWNMYLRWMVRKDNLDLGLWSRVDKKDLILPLDTHTFKVSQKLGLLNRKSYDLKSAMLITEKLREFDPLDPIKYDFALYRLGQEMKV